MTEDLNIDLINFVKRKQNLQNLQTIGLILSKYNKIDENSKKFLELIEESQKIND